MLEFILFNVTGFEDILRLKIFGGFSVETGRDTIFLTKLESSTLSSIRSVRGCLLNDLTLDLFQLLLEFLCSGIARMAGTILFRSV